MCPTSFWGCLGDLFLAQEDVEKETYDHQDQSSYLYSIVVIPAKEETADEQDGTQQDDQDAIFETYVRQLQYNQNFFHGRENK